MKCLLLVILSLCSPLVATQDYIDIVAPYPNQRPNHDRRAQSFLAGRHSPDTMKMFANMLYNYLKGVSVPPRNDDDYDLEDPHIKSKNLELVQDAFEKTSLRRLSVPPRPSFDGPPLPGLPPPLPPPPPSFDDYDIGAPGIPPVESDRPSPPVMPKFRPNRFPLPSTPTPPTSPPPSRVLLFRPSSLRQRPDEFIVRPPPTSQFNSPDGKKSALPPSINQLPYHRPFAIPLPPYSPPSSILRPPPIPHSPSTMPLSAYSYRTNTRVNSSPAMKSTGVYKTAPPSKSNRVKVPCLHRQFMHLLYPKWPLPPPAMPIQTQQTLPASREPIRRSSWGWAR